MSDELIGRILTPLLNRYFDDSNAHRDPNIEIRERIDTIGKMKIEIYPRDRDWETNCIRINLY